MKHLGWLVGILVLALSGNAQTYEAGPYVGGANFIGDVGATNYIRPNSLAIGGVFKWNRSSRHAFRASLLYAGLSADDKQSNELRRKERGYKFENSVLELSVGVEYSFWEWNLHNQQSQMTPYIYTGIAVFNSKQMELRNKNIGKHSTAFNAAIPMALGLKATLDTYTALSFEIGARYTFTDNLDASNPEEIGLDKANAFGNENTNDWYMFIGLTATFSFGRKPCYCTF